MILNQNPSKRQNVVFLKSLLDSQLQSLQGNLKLMQSDNSEIETETIQRLQLIQKFGDDASNGLAQAKSENSKLLKDLSEQKQQHKEVMSDQNMQQNQIKGQLSDLEKSLKMLRTDLETKQASHKTAMLQKQEMLQQTLNELQPQKVGITSGTPRRKDDMTEQRHNLGLLQGQKAEGKNSLRDLKR